MVSVIIPTYQRYDLLLKSIDSVMKQTFLDIEIIVVDDFSYDPRYNELNNYAGIKYIRLEKRLGFPGKVRNVGIKSAKGDWVAFLDDDDYWLPEKLQEQSKHFSNFDFICSDALINGRSYSKDMYLDYWNHANPSNKNELDNSIISRHNVIINSTVVVKKDLIDSIGNFNESVRNGEDHLTWLKITENNNICYFVDKPLINYNTNTYKHYTDEL